MTGEIEGRAWPRRALSFVIGAATENWGMKIMAFLLALIVFIVTRDEVTRSFTIPLRVIDDPERVLLTAPPESVELQLRGPWANVNRLAETQLGSATLDLREVRPGPMELDPAAIVMPRGVVLDRLDYEPVDLRFEALTERRVQIVPAVVGEVDRDYLLGTTRVEPDHFVVRGPASILDEFDELATAPIDIAGISAPLERRVPLAALDPKLRVLGVEGAELPSVRFVAELIPVIGELELAVSTGPVLREAIPGREGELPELERVSVRGPRAVLRLLEGLESPLTPLVEIESDSGAVSVTLRFAWSEVLARDLANQLSIEPPLIRLRLAAAGPVAPVE